MNQQASSNDLGLLGEAFSVWNRVITRSSPAEIKQLREAPQPELQLGERIASTKLKTKRVNSIMQHVSNATIGLLTRKAATLLGALQRRYKTELTVVNCTEQKGGPNAITLYRTHLLAHIAVCSIYQTGIILRDTHQIKQEFKYLNQPPDSPVLKGELPS